MAIFTLLVHDIAQKPTKQKNRVGQETGKWVGKKAGKHGPHVSGVHIA